MIRAFLKTAIYTYFSSTLLCGAGGGPQNTLVVVNDREPESQALGHYYAQQYGIPQTQIFHINMSTNLIMSTATYSNVIRNPILNYLEAQALTNQVEYIVYCRGIPHRVRKATNNENSLTSASYYDFRDATKSGACSTPGSGSVNDYFEQERSLTPSDEPIASRKFISSMLTGWTSDEARTFIDRSVAANNSSPTSQVYLLHTTDVFRNVQWYEFEDTAFLTRFLDGPVKVSIQDGNQLNSTHDIMGYTVGRASIGGLPSNTFFPGSIGEHVTSFGGRLFESSQMSIHQWIRYGCSGSYGTVTEPCNYTQKFPETQYHYWYARGFSLGESLFMSIENPYEGLVVGDPLCAPYASPPEVSIIGITAEQTITGSTNLTLTATPTITAHQVHRIDLFLDGTYASTLTNSSPTAGNQISSTINGTTRSYTVNGGDSIYDAASGLASAINANPPLIPATAAAMGDRIVLTQKTRGTNGQNIAYTGMSSLGSGSHLSINCQAIGTNFLETTHPARQRITLTGSPASNDQIVATIRRLDGSNIVNSITSDGTESIATLLQNLMNTVNANAELQGTDGCIMKYRRAIGSPQETYIVARTNHWNSYNVEVDYHINNAPGSTLSGSYTGKLTSNNDVMSARGTLFISAGSTNLTSPYTLDTTLLSDGPHELHVVAYDGSGLRTQGHQTIPFTVDNHDLSCTITDPLSIQNYERGQPITSLVSATASPGSVTSVQFYVEGKLLSESTLPPHLFSWNTTNTGAGLIELKAQAFDSLGNRTYSETTSIRVYDDRDSDGIADWWEWEQFGSITNYNHSDDLDNDGYSHYEEYVADTSATDSNDLLLAQIDYSNAVDQVSIAFPSSALRIYGIELNDSQITNTPGWATTSNRFWGTGELIIWNDHPSNTPPSSTAHRYYRVLPQVP